MPSQRRMRLYGVLVLVTIIVLMYMSRAGHQTQNSDFYTKTQQALQEREHAEAAKQRDAESVQLRLKAAEEQAKKSAEEKYTSDKEAVEGPGKKGVAGRVEIDSQDDKKVPGVAAQGGRSRDQAAMKKDETMEDHEVEMEMNAILKKSPGTP
jgi:Tfp pilus assembly protein PilX